VQLPPMQLLRRTRILGLGGPCSPCGPAGPGGPTGPVGPAAPVSPLAPGGPGWPGSPFGPWPQPPSNASPSIKTANEFSRRLSMVPVRIVSSQSRWQYLLGASFGSKPCSFGSKPCPFGSKPCPFGSKPCPFGSKPCPFGSKPCPFGSKPWDGRIRAPHIRIHTMRKGGRRSPGAWAVVCSMIAAA
jgi:hypothetical protein